MLVFLSHYLQTPGVAATKLAKELGPGHRIVTLLCDRYESKSSQKYSNLNLQNSGARHLSKFWANTEPIGGSDDATNLDALLGL